MGKKFSPQTSNFPNSLDIEHHLRFLFPTNNFYMYFIVPSPFTPRVFQLFPRRRAPFLPYPLSHPSKSVQTKVANPLSTFPGFRLQLYQRLVPQKELTSLSLLVKPLASPLHTLSLLSAFVHQYTTDMRRMKRKGSTLSLDICQPRGRIPHVGKFVGAPSPSRYPRSTWNKAICERACDVSRVKVKREYIQRGYGWYLTRFSTWKFYSTAIGWISIGRIFVGKIVSV